MTVPTARGYELREELGSGQFGVVHLASQPSVSREVAVKVIRTEWAQNEQFVRRFEREAEVVASLEHPFVVPLYDYWRGPDAAYLVMRYLRGGSLGDAIADGGWDLTRVTRLVDQLGSALDAAHRRGIVHRDLKPENVLLDEDGNMYLADFGIAKDLVADSLTLDGGAPGSPGYMAPEQLEGNPVSQRTDIYAFGLLLYEVLKGAHAFPATSLASVIAKQLSDPVPSLDDPDVPASIDAVIARATAKDSDDRYADVLELISDWHAAVDPARPAPTVDVGRLPRQATSFVGRRQELGRGLDLLDQSRLLTLVGPPGTGKTRLAIALAGRATAEVVERAYFVPLAEVTDPGHIVDAIGRTLDVVETETGARLESIEAMLAERATLLVLDNFEHLIEGAPIVAGLVEAVPNLKVMVTSRASLGLSAEQDYPIPPLQAPSSDELVDPEALADYDAVALFVARAKASDPSFALDEGNASSVAAITDLLDGLPLAIELAASRVRLLSPRDLVERLGDRLGLLTSGPSDAARRHRTLRDAIAWSYELLDPDEQAVFRRLGLFRGFTLEAATRVSGYPEMVSLEAIDSLLSKSLLYRVPGAARARFALLESIREFALEQLDESGDDEETSARFVEFFREIGQSAEPLLESDPGGESTLAFHADIDNLFGAVRVAAEVGMVDVGLLVAKTVWRLWHQADRMGEGRDAIEFLLRDEAASTAARAGAFEALAGLAYWQADYDGALSAYEHALDAYRAVDDRSGQAEVLYGMSMTAGFAADLDLGTRLAAEARTIFLDLGSEEGLGRVALAQGLLAWQRRDYEAARGFYAESAEAARRAGRPAQEANELMGVGVLTVLVGEREEGFRIMREMIDRLHELRNDHLVIWGLDFVSALTAADQPIEAVRLGAAVDRLRQEAGGGPVLSSIGMDDAAAIAGRAVSSEALDAAWRSGRSLSLEDAFALGVELMRNDGQG